MVSYSCLGRLSTSAEFRRCSLGCLFSKSLRLSRFAHLVRIPRNSFGDACLHVNRSSRELACGILRLSRLSHAVRVYQESDQCCCTSSTTPCNIFIVFCSLTLCPCNRRHTQKCTLIQNLRRMLPFLMPPRRLSVPASSSSDNKFTRQSSTVIIVANSPLRTSPYRLAGRVGTSAHVILCNRLVY